MFKTPEMRSLIACGLILGTPFASGCGSSELEEVKKIEANTQKNARGLDRTFSPAMAKIGRKAIKFIDANPDNGFIYKMGRSKNLSISRDNGYEVDIFLVNGAETKKIKNGDVESVIIKRDKADSRANEIRIEPVGDDSGVCARGSMMASSERFDTTGEDNGLISFITTNRCEGYILNPNFDDSRQELNPTEAAERIVNDMNFHFKEATAR